MAAVEFFQNRSVAHGAVGKRRHPVKGKESIALHEGHVGPGVDRRVDTVELRQVTTIGDDIHLLMRPLMRVCSSLRPDNRLDHCHAARDLLPLKPSSLRARLEDRGDAPPLVLAYGGGRPLGAVEAMAYGEIRQRRIASGKLIEIEGLQMITGSRASGNR